jgi:hypothetical protein
MAKLVGLYLDAKTNALDCGVTFEFLDNNSS